jgi:hypothetical protein
MPMPAFAPVLKSSGEDEGDDVDVGVEVCEKDLEMAVKMWSDWKWMSLSSGIVRS